MGGGIPIDGGRYWSDKRRLLGDGKTVRGFVGGILSGIIVGLIQVFAQEISIFSLLPRMTLTAVILLATGSLVGDLIKSFFKRRAGITRGGKWPVIDQYDFLIGAFVFLIIGDFQFAEKYFTIPVILAVLVITPVLHRVVNIIGYKMGVKEVPW